MSLFSFVYCFLLFWVWVCLFAISLKEGGRVQLGCTNHPGCTRVTSSNASCTNLYSSLKAVVCRCGVCSINATWEITSMSQKPGVLFPDRNMYVRRGRGFCMYFSFSCLCSHFLSFFVQFVLRSSEVKSTHSLGLMSVLACFLS